MDPEQTMTMAALNRILVENSGRVYTAAVLLVEDARGPLFQTSVGVPDPESDPVQIGLDTPFDLASISKLFTAAAALRLVATDRLTLDDPVQKYLPGFSGPGKELVTIRHLLTHSSGLPAMVRLYGPQGASGDPWDAILGSQLQATPGASITYSDVGFMVLGKLVEEVTGLPLPRAMDLLVLDPLALKHVGYGPCPTAPATELDPWRGRRVRGEVHDENAAVLGGAAGHAGLFGPAADVAALARAFLRPDGAFLPVDLARRAVSVQAEDETERRGLGWDLRSPVETDPEAPFSEGSFGHYGFTGTAVWADPEREIITVLLTNRVYFGRDPEPIRRARREIFSAVAATLPLHRDESTN